MLFHRVSRTIKTLPGSLRSRALLLHGLFSFLLLVTVAAAQTDKLPFVTDADMGIYTYDSIVHAAQQPVNVRIHLRFMCSPGTSSGIDSGTGGSTTLDSSSSSSSIAVEGFVSTYVLTTQPPPWAPGTPHYYPFNIQQHLGISITSRTDNAPLAWVGPKDWGLWRVHAQLSGPGPFQLQVAGSDAFHDLPHPLCPQPAQPGAPNLAGGIWNVLTTTSNSTLDPKRLAFLVLQHHTYHRTVGFSGTILRSNLHESKEMLRLPDVSRAVEQEGLIIWPWEQEHVAGWSTHYWQRPKNQLTLLGAYGRDAKLAYFDLDEYLVLPSGNGVADAECFGKPLLDVDDATGVSTTGSSSSSVQGPVGSWTFVRFQAKTCPWEDADLPCWEAGRSVTSEQPIELLHDVCPMSTSHGKQILAADRVDTVSVHFTESGRYPGNRLVDISCGHLLHFYSLLEGRRAGVTGILRKIPALTWDVDPAAGRRQLRWPEGLAPLTYQACTSTGSARLDTIIAYKRRYKARHGVLPVIGRQPA